MNYQILGGATPDNSFPLGDSHKLDLETSKIKHWEYIPPKVETIRDVFRGRIERNQITTKEELISYLLDKGMIHLEEVSKSKKKKRFSKKQNNTYQKNDVLDISDPNKEDENLIMIGGIAGEEFRKFGQNLKSFSEWKGEVSRVLKG